MTFADKLEQAIIDAAETALRRAATRASKRAEDATDGAAAEKHRRDAASWSTCADDVAAMKGPCHAASSEVA